MSESLNLERLAKLFSHRGEKVVVVLPSGEAVVLVPLGEYEKLVAAKPLPAVSEVRERRNGGRPATRPEGATKAPNSLEAVDPPQGALPDDDQYYPEPLEP